MTAYDLPDFVTVNGTFKTKIYSEYAGLTVPTTQTIKSVGDTTETAMRDLGVSDVSTMRLELRDDRTVYAQGFWYKVTQGSFLIRFYLSEGGTDKFYDFVQAQDDQILWTEWAIVGGIHYRTTTATFISAAKAMLDTPTATWMAEALSHASTTGYTNPTAIYKAISLQGFFASLLKASTLNSAYHEEDLTFVYDQQDIKYKVGSTVYQLEDLFIATQFQDGGGTHNTDYFQANPLSDKFALAGSLLGPLLFNFGLVLHMDYDPATERHKMQLIQRGHAYATKLVLASKEKASTIRKSTALFGDSVKISGYGTVGYVWRSKKYSNAYTSTPPPNYITFDIDKQMIFETDPTMPIGSTYGLYAYEGIIGGIATWTLVDSIEFWNYTTQAYDTPAVPNDFAEALCGYYFHRFTTKFSQVVRVYKSMTASDGSTDSFRNLNVMRRTDMDLDGEGNVTYYANKVTKRPMASECEIEWIRE